MMAPLLGLAAITLAVGEPPASPPPPASPETTTTAEAAAAPVRPTLVLDDVDTSSPGLRRELALRLGDRPLARARGAPRPPAPPFIWISARRAGAETVEVRLIVSDGRLFARTVEAPDEQRARIVAGTIANMLDGIEQNRLAPQQTGVVVPALEATPGPETAPASTPEPAAEPAPSPAPDDETAAPGPRPRAWIGVLGTLASTFGVGPPAAVAGPTGLGGSLGAVLVHRGGAIAALDLRATAWQNTGVRLTRLRISAVGGYAWRPGRFEVLAALGPTLEVARFSADLVKPSGSPRQPAPLLGGRLLTRPAYAALRRPTLALLVGLEAELSAAFEARTPPGAVQIYRQRPSGFESIARLGGLELGVALTVEGRFALGGAD